MLIARSSVLVLATLAAACSESRQSVGFEAGNRVLHPVTDTVLMVGGSAQDTALFAPTMLAWTDAGIVVWDRDRTQVLLFSAEGRLLWRYGSRGSGPGEFAGVTEIAADDEKRVWVLDPGNDRLSILSSSGELIRAFRLPDVGYVDRLMPMKGGRAMLMGLDTMLHIIDEHGNLLLSRRHPYTAYPSLHPVSGYNRGLYDPSTDSTAFFFYYGGGFARSDAALTPTPSLNAYVEDIPFPEVTVQRSENADGSTSTSTAVNTDRLAATAAAVDRGVVHVLFDGDTEYGDRVIDRYAIGSGDYLGSWLLPDTARTLAVNDGLIATIVENPFPTLIVRRAPD